MGTVSGLSSCGVSIWIVYVQNPNHDTPFRATTRINSRQNSYPAEHRGVYQCIQRLHTTHKLLHSTSRFHSTVHVVL